MTQNYRNVSVFSIGIFMLAATQNLYGAVDDVTGDVGTAQSGSIALSGGISGSVFDSTSTTIVQSFNFLSLPIGSSTNGQILIAGETVLHNLTPGNANMFIGGFAGNPSAITTSAANCTGCGAGSLSSILSGNANTGIGHGALGNLTTGASNTAVGDSAGSNLVDGNGNLLLGSNAGSLYNTDESNNIILGSNEGVQGETLTIRIGDGGAQTACYVDGIYSASVSIDTALPVFIDIEGKLATLLSSTAVKDAVTDIGNDSQPIFNLRPVEFHFKSDPKKIKQFGLVAEEVNKVFPDLVVLKDKKPFAVRYHELPVLMLNEMQKQQNRIATLEDTVQKLTARIEKLEKRKK